MSNRQKVSWQLSNIVRTDFSLSPNRNINKIGIYSSSKRKKTLMMLTNERNERAKPQCIQCKTRKTKRKETLGERRRGKRTIAETFSSLFSRVSPFLSLSLPLWSFLFIVNKYFVLRSWFDTRWFCRCTLFAFALCFPRVASLPIFSPCVSSRLVSSH